MSAGRCGRWVTVAAIQALQFSCTLGFKLGLFGGQQIIDLYGLFVAQSFGINVDKGSGSWAVASTWSRVASVAQHLNIYCGRRKIVATCVSGRIDSHLGVLHMLISQDKPPSSTYNIQLFNILTNPSDLNQLVDSVLLSPQPNFFCTNFFLNWEGGSK